MLKINKIKCIQFYLKIKRLIKFYLIFMQRKKRNLRMQRITFQIGNEIEIFELDSDEELKTSKEKTEEKIDHIKSLIYKDPINNEIQKGKENLVNTNLISKNTFNDPKKKSLPHIDSIWKLNEKDLFFIFGENYYFLQKKEPLYLDSNTLI